ncbi:tetratricopeptide repeat protein, partial [Segatella oris]
WEIALHVYTALGDCCFNLGNYPTANSYYNKALLCPDAVECGYVWLGLGQSFYELENMEKAKDALMSAYMLEGKEIFEDVDEKYFNIIKDHI